MCYLGHAACHRNRKATRTEVDTGSGATAVTGLTMLLGGEMRKALGLWTRGKQFNTASGASWAILIGARVANGNNIRNRAIYHSCDILIKNVTASCSCSKSLCQDKLKSFALISLAKAYQEPNIEPVIWF